MFWSIFILLPSTLYILMKYICCAAQTHRDSRIIFGTIIIDSVKFIWRTVTEMANPIIGLYGNTVIKN